MGRHILIGTLLYCTIMYFDMFLWTCCFRKCDYLWPDCCSNNNHESDLLLWSKIEKELFLLWMQKRKNKGNARGPRRLTSFRWEPEIHQKQQNFENLMHSQKNLINNYKRSDNVKILSLCNSSINFTQLVCPRWYGMA